MKDNSNSAGNLLAKSSPTNSIREIKKLHGEILNATKTSLDKAFKIGELLTNVKGNLQHGEWLPWAQKYLPFTDRTARNYIRCYEERARLKLESVSNLTCAYLALAELKTVPQPLPSIDLSAPVSEAQLGCFLKSRDITIDLPDDEGGGGDFIAMATLGIQYATGLIPTGQEILDLLAGLNPERDGVA